LKWQAQSGAGELVAQTTLHHSQEEFHRLRLPWRAGLIRLDCGPIVVAYLHRDVGAAPTRVVVEARLDRAGAPVLVALPTGGSTVQIGKFGTEDDLLREMGSDPKSCNVLIVDGQSATGQSLVRAMLAADAAMVSVGYNATWERTAAFEAVSRLDRVVMLPLDVTDADSVCRAGAELGSKLDILINNAQARVRSGASGVDGEWNAAHAEMDVNYFGLLRLAGVFGPLMRQRATAQTRFHGAAWVNILSVYALASLPGRATFSASKAAACSLAQGLRGQLQTSGVRVINVFPGTIDDEASHDLPLPRLNPRVLAKAVVQALREGVEDVYPGEVAQEWLERWRENPKALEREIAATQSATEHR
jgi:NAD(P)-dependent dehydrogenase (short-subunit alcohol dehydrogenase family)